MAFLRQQGIEDVFKTKDCNLPSKNALRYMFIDLQGMVRSPFHHGLLTQIFLVTLLRIIVAIKSMCICMNKLKKEIFSEKRCAKSTHVSLVP